MFFLTRFFKYQNILFKEPRKILYISYPGLDQFFSLGRMYSIENPFEFLSHNKNNPYPVTFLKQQLGLLIAKNGHKLDQNMPWKIVRTFFQGNDFKIHPKLSC